MLVLVDTSVWIHLLHPKSRAALPADQLARIATCPPVIQEVFQGLRPGPAAVEFQNNFLALPCLSSPLPVERFLEAADIYAQARRRGMTVRASADCLIASIALHERVPIWHRDRDFAAIAKFTALQAAMSFAEF